MKLPTMPFSLDRVIRTLQSMFALMVLVLSASVARWYNNTTPYPSPAQFNFLIAVAAWSLISLIAVELLPRFLPRIPKPHLVAPFDVTNALFHLGGLVALAVFMSNLLFCGGDICYIAQGNVAASAVSFALWAASAALAVLDMVKARRGGGAGVPGPGMQKVDV